MSGLVQEKVIRLTYPGTDSIYWTVPVALQPGLACTDHAENDTPEKGLPTVMVPDPVLGGVSFDLFGTLVAVERPADPGAAVARELRSAFEGDIETRDGVRQAVTVASRGGPVGVLSNCSVPGVVERSLKRSDIPLGRLDAVVSSD